MPLEVVEVLAALTSLREESREGFRALHERLDKINGRVRETEVRLGELHHVESELARCTKNIHDLREHVNVVVGQVHAGVGKLTGEIEVRKEQIATIYTWVKTEEADRKADHQSIVTMIQAEIRKVMEKLDPLTTLQQQAVGVVWLLRIGALSGLFSLTYIVLRAMKVIQ